MHVYAYDQGAYHVYIHILIYVYVCDQGAVTVTEADMETLLPGEYLNDSIMDVFIKWWALLT